MEITVPDLAGSLGGGGRYDNLIGMFLGRDVPACGFSLGLERIIVVMSERSMFPTAVEAGGVDVMVTIWNEETRAESLALAAELRAAGSVSMSIRKRINWAGSSSTRRLVRCRSWRFWEMTNGRVARSQSRTCARAIRRRWREAPSHRSAASGR